MDAVTAQRTLVKSPPELWSEVSDASALAKHLGAFGEIRITRIEAETTVAWEGERASGTVELEPSGWGTRVTITAEPAVASSGLTNVVGSPESGAPASLVISQTGQVAPSTTVEIRKNGTLRMKPPGTASLERLILNGGRLEARKLTVVNAEFSEGAVVRLAPENSQDVPLTVTGPAWDWNGTVTAEVAIPQPPVLNSKFVLVRWRGAGPFPGRFEGLPDGQRIPLGGASARVTYAGGDGNDLEILILPGESTPPDPPSVTPTSTGTVALRWPAAAACQLEFRPNLLPTTPWTPVKTPPPANGEIQLEINPATDSTTGYYRLACP